MQWSRMRCFISHQPRPHSNLQPTTAIDNHRETILLYRALLRQCTYLPDSAARKYMWSHVVERFRAYQPIARTKDGPPLRRRIKRKEPLKALKDARKSLKYLQRANDGHMPQLRNVLEMTYGRVGKRGRQLMAKLQALGVLDAPLSTITSSGEISQDLTRTHKKVPQLSDEILALLKSQIKQGSSRFNGAPLREIQPKIPAVNSWGRPFPQKRKANFIRKWYATTMERLMPPLPAVEWERLRDLASGEIPWDGPVPRRTLGTTSADESPPEAFSWITAHDHLPHRLTSSTARVVEKGRHEAMRTNPHELTPRLMRRMWTTVFQKCPRLDWSHEKGQWVVTWGRIGKQSDLVFDAQKPMPAGMFDGVDEDGKVCRE